MKEGHRERLKDTFVAGGIDPLSKYNVMEMILFYAIPRKDVTAIAHDLIDKFGSLSKVFDASIEDLMSVGGVGRHCAILIKLFPEVSRRYLEDKNGEPTLDDEASVKRYCLSIFSGETVEKAYLVCFDSRGKFIRKVLIAQGSLTMVDFDKRRLMEAIVRHSAKSVVLVHNHPSGVTAPSRPDVESTGAIARLMQELSVDFVDHLIVADNDIFSMRQHVNFTHMFL